MKYILATVAAAALLCACGQNQRKNLPPQPSMDELRAQIPGPEKAYNSGPITVDANGQAIIRGTIDGVGDSLVYTIAADSNQIVSVRLAPDEEPANIRIRQFISPSGEADGPFGLKLDRRLDTTGVWKLIIDESLMNGEDYKGAFTMTVIVQ